MRVDVLTIFPAYLAPLELSLIGRARAAGLLELHVHDLRGWAGDRHRTVDDTPYGGGAGMVMKPGPWGAALDAVLSTGPSLGAGEERGGPEVSAARLVVPTPSGRRFTQHVAAELAAEPWLLFACGRYEGIDRRVIEDAASRVRVDELSLGDYVLAGGEAAVLVIVEAVARLVPGVLGNAESLAEESHAASHAGLLEYPVYTKPPVWRGRAVPEVLLSGNHRAIARWRREQALRRTASARPDLVAALDPALLDPADLLLLGELGWSVRAGRLVRDGPAVAD